ncbi:MAG: isoprenoid biosynthesis glyoxalase ElbB [Candidatus Cloacimonetes bacterium]|nr:isoprenoid biosynthesis glyoxalase ElbB [Candidatus Cloacimonadota bacterium]
MKRVALLLAGCGNRDGSEIHESVYTILALSKAGAEIVYFAPDREQYHVLNYLTGKPMPEKRNILLESARISRGNIKPISQANLNDFDALIMPGGAGAGKNFCDFIIKGTDGTMMPDVKEFIMAVHKAGKPIGAICIIPAILMLMFKNTGLKITPGLDKEWLNTGKKMGVEVEMKSSSEITVDEKFRIVSTPAFMNDAPFNEVYQGIEKLVNKILEWI